MHSSGQLLTSDKVKISYHHYQSGFEKVIIIAHGFSTSKNNKRRPSRGISYEGV